MTQNISSLRNQVIGTLVARSKRSGNPEIREIAEQWWNDAEVTFKKRGYRNFNLVNESLNLLPSEVKQGTAEMDLVVVAFAFQWSTPVTRNKYLSYKLSKVLQWPDRDSHTVQQLSEVDRDLSLLTAFAPISTIYDLNMIRLAFDQKVFMSNLVLASLTRPMGVTLDFFIQRQRAIFDYLLKRGRIFSHPITREKYEKKAIENLAAYLNKGESRVKEDENLVLTKAE